MRENDTHNSIRRREFLRGVAGGALALGTGQLLSGGPAAAQNGSGEIRVLLSTFLAASVLDIRIKPDGSVTQQLFAKFGVDIQGRAEATAGIVVAGDNVFVFSPTSDRLFMLDKATGARKRTITGPFMTTSHNGSIGPDGLLYTVNAPTLNGIAGSGRPDSIERFDPETGDHIDTFAESNTNPVVKAPFGIEWGPDGDLYVASVLAYGFDPTTFPFRSDHIVRLDGQTGEFKGFVVRETHLTFTFAFHPSGRMLVPSHFFNRVYVYDPTNSRLVEGFGDVDLPIGVEYGPDGDLYVASFSTLDHLDPLLDSDASNDAQAQGFGKLVVFDGMNGGPIKRTIVSGLPFAGFLAFA